MYRCRRHVLLRSTHDAVDEMSGNLDGFAEDVAGKFAAVHKEIQMTDGVKILHAEDVGGESPIRMLIGGEGAARKAIQKGATVAMVKELFPRLDAGEVAHEAESSDRCVAPRPESAAAAEGGTS